MGLKILCHLRTSYAPFATSGADIMCERINAYMAAKGCEVVTVVDKNIQPYMHKGVQVASANYALGERYKWADVILTHLVDRSESTALAARYKKPLFHVCHNDNTSTLRSGMPDNYAIYNSEHLKASSPVKLPGIVVNPPTWLSEWGYKDHYGEQWHTMVNCVANKGPEMLYQLATELNLQFVGVRGGYGQQIEKRSQNNNLRYVPFTPYIATVYNETRVLLIPSIKESWSLTGAEAQCSGIPVICSDLPGLRENLGDGAIYCENKRGYMDALARLQDKAYYSEIALKGLENQRRKNYAAQLDNLLNFMCMKAGIPVVATNIGGQDFERLAGIAIDETGTPAMPQPKEKKEVKPAKEKVLKNRNGTDAVK